MLPRMVKKGHNIIQALVTLLLLLTTSTLADIPGCDYFDTVDLSESKKFPNGSYGYEKLIIPPDQTGEYDYEILVDGEKVDVPKHLRGCACKLGACVRFCCHHNLMLIEGERKCSGDINEAVDFDPFVNITLSDGRVVRKHILDDFVVQRHLPVPCSGHYHLDALHDESEKWSLYENGNLLRHYTERKLSKQEYCLQPHPIRSNENETIISLVPHMCEDPLESPWPITIVLILTIICLILTTIVYVTLARLRNKHGYFLVCYMLCLLVAYTLLLLDKFRWPEEMYSCLLNGYVGYFAVMASFLWLTVISFDLYISFRGSYTVQRSTPRSLLTMYELYVYGIAISLTFCVILIDFKMDMNNDDELFWMPGVGVYTCWIKTDDWSAMIYFYGPMSLQIVFNVIMFILTALRIVNVMKDIGARQGRHKRLNSDRQTYGLFVRLFVIMGVTWTFEIFSYLSQNHGMLMKIFLFFDYLNASQGIIIFILFVLKRSVLKLISDRIRGIKATSEDGGSEEEIALQNMKGDIKNFSPSILH